MLQSRAKVPVSRDGLGVFPTEGRAFLLDQGQAQIVVNTYIPTTTTDPHQLLRNYRPA